MDIATVGKGKGGDACTAAAFFKVSNFIKYKFIYITNHNFNLKRWWIILDGGYLG